MIEVQAKRRVQVCRAASVIIGCSGAAALGTYVRDGNLFWSAAWGGRGLETIASCEFWLAAMVYSCCLGQMSLLDAF